MAPSFQIEDRVRNQRLTRPLGDAATAADFLEALIVGERLPTHTFRRQPLDYRLVFGTELLSPGRDLRALPDGSTLGLECPEAGRVWLRVHELIGRVEDEVRVEAGRQKARVEQHIRGEVDAAVDQIAEGLTKPIRDVREAADDLVRSATDQITSDVKHRIEGIKSRLLGEVSSRLRGETSTIGLGSRLRARRDISRLAKTGVLRADAEPIRQSLRGLAAAGVERVAAVAVVTSALTAAAAVAATGDGDPATSTTMPATQGSTAADRTTTTAVAGDSAALRIEIDDPSTPVNAGSDLELTWASDGAVLDLVVVIWEAGHGRTWTTAYDEGVPGATVPIPLDAPPFLTVRVVGASGDGRAQDEIELHVNQPPSVAGRSIVTTEGSGPQREDLGATVDDDLASIVIEGARGTFEIDQNRWLLFDPGVLGPGAFGACVVATDEGGLASQAWMEIEVLPAIGRGDSLWEISRRLLVTEGNPDPSVAEINDRMLSLRLQRWLLDPDLIFSEDVVSELIELEPVKPMGPCRDS